MRITIRIAILATFVPILLFAQATSPPRPLHMVGDHWTPYSPPTEFPEGSTVHIVVRGDTLWDLATQYLGDPYLWPQIWERNPYILDSHWIYPGDPVVIDVAIQEPAEPVADEAPPDEIVSDDYPPEDLESTEMIEEAMPYPLGNSADVYCFARIFEDEGVFPFAIQSAEKGEFQDHFSSGDVLYIDGGSEEGVQPGDRFFVFNRLHRLRHPATNEDLGIVYKQVGQLKVLCAQEHSSISEITLACDEVGIGDTLLPFEPIPVPLVIDPDPTDRCDTPTGNASGYIIHSRDDVLNTGSQMVVLIDLGQEDGIYPGQFATLFRPNPVEDMPRLVMGMAGILTVYENYSSAKVTTTWAPLYVGDQVEMR